MIKEIEIRRSVREYKDMMLSDEDFNIVNEAAKDIQPLNQNIRYDVIPIKNGSQFSNAFKLPIGKVKAPHYLLFVSEEKEQYLENIGFIGEQIVLKLTEYGIGTCWLGSIANNKKKIKKLVSVEDGLQPVMIIAFGYPTKELVPVEDRKRKKIDKIFKGKIDKNFISIAKALQAAPSGLNSQPWRVFIQDEEWNYYIEPKKGLLKKIYKNMNKIDAGIGLTHILYEGMKSGYVVNFKYNKIVNEVKEFEYIITISFGR